MAAALQALPSTQHRFSVSLSEGFWGSSLVAPWGTSCLFCPRVVSGGARQGLGGVPGPPPSPALRPCSMVTEWLVADPHGSTGRPPGLRPPAPAVQRRHRRHHPGPPDATARGCTLWTPPGGQAAGGEGGKAQLPSPGEEGRVGWTRGEGVFLQMTVHLSVCRMASHPFILPARKTTSASWSCC